MHFVVLQGLLSAIGISWNSILLVIVFVKLSANIKPCAIVVTVKAVVDILASGLAGFLLERFLSTGDTVMIISTGFCSSTISCFSWHIFFLSFLQFNLLWLVASYLFRFFILHKNEPKSEKVAFAAIAVYLPILIGNVFCINLLAENQKFHAPKMLYQRKDQVLAGWVVQVSSMVVMGILWITSVLVYLFYLSVRFSLTTFVKKNKARLSKRSFVFHQKLLQTIHCQSAIPILLFLGSNVFFLMHFSILNPIQVQYLPIVFFIMTTIISPTSYFLFLPPQWNFCFGVSKNFRAKNNNAVEDTNTVTAQAVSVF